MRERFILPVAALELGDAARMIKVRPVRDKSQASITTNRSSAASRGGCRKMKAVMWKAIFASLNPSPVFESVAMFAEALTIGRCYCGSRKVDGEDESVSPKP
jgi:hypothetical protein